MARVAVHGVLKSFEPHPKGGARCAKMPFLCVALGAPSHNTPRPLAMWHIHPRGDLGLVVRFLLQCGRFRVQFPEQPLGAARFCVVEITSAAITIRLLGLVA